MGLEEVKKQVLLLHQSVLTLDSQDQQEAIDFLNDCFSELRLKPLSYEDLGGQVLNLSTFKKNSFISEPEDHFVNFRFPYFYDSHNFDGVDNDVDVGCFEYQEPMPILPSENYEKENIINSYADEENTNETTGPVNLVMPTKQRVASPNVKKSRRKQMFTRKNVRRLSGKVVDSAKEAIKKANNKITCPGCFDRLESAEFSSHIKSHDPVSLSCRLCRYSFNSILQFWRHKEEKKCRVRAGLVCPECGDKFKFESHYMKHLRGHRDNNCKHCSEKFSSRAQCREHMKRVHPDIIIEKDLIPCKYCPMSFPRLHRLYNHYRLHHSKGKFVCTTCGLFLSTKEKHKEHVLVHENEKKWKCDICLKKFYSRNLLSNHMKIHNSGKYKCLTCDVTVASKVQLMDHKRKNHNVKGLEPTFKCDVCQKLFRKKSSLGRHMSTHSDEKLFNCKECVKAFSTLGGLMKHQKLKTHFNKAKVIVPESKYEKVYEDQLVCENCGKQYKTYSLFKSHLRTHKGLFKCEKCDKSFTVKVNLMRHMKNHDKVRMAVCELCGDSFFTMGAMRDHTQIKHTDERPAKCTVCEKTFKRNSELNRHMRVHDNGRPYVCFCGRDYKQIAHLRGHQKSAHGKGVVEETVTEDVNKRSTLQPLLADRDRSKDFTNEHNNLLSLENFEQQDYRLQDSFKVPYVPDDYGQHMGYGDLQFGAPPAVSPAVDLSMVSIADMDSGLSKVEVKPVNSPTEPATSIPLVNLSEHIVQEYLLNLPQGNDCTFFTRKEILRVQKRFREINPEIVPKAMTKDEPISIRVPMQLVTKLPELRENPFRQRICEVFSHDGKGDLSFEDFLDLLSVFSEHAPRDIKVFYAFKIYDFDGDQHIGPQDIEQALRLLTRNELTLEEMQMIGEKVIEECDVDGDGKLSYMEFEHVILRAPEFLSTFHIRM